MSNEDKTIQNAAPDHPLAGRIALVAGATRGAGRAQAVELGRAGATVYVTGRTTRNRASEVGRTSETIEETAEFVTAAGGTGIAVPTDHLDEDQVRALARRIDGEQGRLDVLVNDLWGGEHLLVGSVFGRKSWETPLADGLRILELGVRSHVITAALLLPLLIRSDAPLHVEVTDGTARYNRRYRENMYYDLAKTAPIRLAFGLGQELAEYGGTAVAVSPGFLRSEQMLAHFGVREENWRDAIAREPAFAIAESPQYLARAVAALAADPGRAARWNGKSTSSGELAKAYGVRDVDGSRPDAWAYFEDVLHGGKEASPEDYR
ncbi:MULTISPECIES: SDR family oxidoreductase [Streptomyces]|uniref:Short-chain dehydrogenase n=1 Tax=Streptomyces virginiae TaxID=1961 RepID=A0ABQ3NRC5_STRVG|nr:MULTISPECIES: SDR family oxidoreductase [Streptomyces]KOU16937.1 short-chain dehydrogenase [Streptomyces sp. WM6349]KOU89442.1 short-chain dehydrogenase [Streptomyces sp. XY593]KOU96671.1 short-chain dehydrogenase [Streptomyces sp. XY533]KOV37908.1 short-chain dehydrogenase [Streptomyces sp. H036]MBP2348107.1 NAD(P)-dependent dehydrogenase (short-subunit alcohol dehydrogenase family) [Streptomyces virginiae]